MTKDCSEKIAKKLIGRTKIEDALKRLDRLTQEEARMASVQNLKITRAVDDRVKVVDSKVTQVIAGALNIFSQSPK